MLPKQVVYIIEQYKFEAAAVFYMAMIAIIFPLVVTAQDSLSRQRSSVSALSSTEVLSHTVIDPNRPIAPKSPYVVAAAQNLTAGVAPWPLQGKVTTEFGVPHRPWQDRHTGIDISSGQRSGSAQITAFREGTVIKAVRSGSGYGNHVVLDHGGGLTSLYAHLSSISITEGQTVRAGGVLGYEGISGTTTGTHLHFEIRQDGKPVNPHSYIEGNP